MPGLLPIVVGTKVKFPNHDQIQHHVYSFSRTKTFELPLYKGEDAAPVLFDKVGVVKVGCNIHDWMSAIILVLPTPWFARTGADGAFTIENVPQGRHSVVAWHELSKLKPEDLDRAIPFFTGPTTIRDILWGMIMSHGIHHRGQLALMCRLAGGVCPGLYGPNREESAAMRAGAAPA